MSLTKEEYEKKLSELRAERNRHQAEANRLAREMDELETDSDEANKLVNQYILDDNSKRGGYKYYFHVTSWSKRERGIFVDGFGFYVAPNGFITINFHSIMWSTIDDIKIISEENFVEALNKSIECIRDECLAIYKNPDERKPSDFKTKLPLFNKKSKFDADIFEKAKQKYNVVWEEEQNK